MRSVGVRVFETVEEVRKVYEVYHAECDLSGPCVVDVYMELVYRLLSRAIERVVEQVGSEVAPQVVMGACFGNDPSVDEPTRLVPWLYFPKYDHRVLPWLYDNGEIRIPGLTTGNLYQPGGVDAFVDRVVECLLLKEGEDDNL